MNKLPTAEEFFKEKYGSNDRIAIDNAILLSKEFAKLHVEAALESASENVGLSYKNSILNAYPEKNIK